MVAVFNDAGRRLNRKVAANALDLRRIEAQVAVQSVVLLFAARSCVVLAQLFVRVVNLVWNTVPYEV